MKDQDLNISNCHHLFSRQATKNVFWLVFIFFPILVSSCTDSKYSQCQQMFHIAQSVTKNEQKLEFGDRQIPPAVKTKNWLSAASTMNQAADNMMALKIDQIELIDYRNKLASIYSIYAQATYDAVKANEDKNLEALHAARNDAAKAGEMQRNLVREINAYCTVN